jgi:uncharacterized repeat protein (TIGR03803 family)
MLYGTTTSGGTNGYGTVFKIGTNGAGYGVLYNFGSTAGDGQLPQAGLVQGKDGALYGTTPYGATNILFGTVFKINTDGTGYSVLHNFGSTGVDGQVPGGVLAQGSDSALYGTTQFGGTTASGRFSGSGTMFKISTNGSDYIVLYSFGTATGDGRSPQAGLLQGGDGAMYGTTIAGGDIGLGTVFRWTVGTAPTFTQVARLPDGNVGLSLSAMSNVVWRLDATTNLAAVTWLPLTYVASPSGTIIFSDLTATNYPRRLYRAVAQ